MTEPFHFFEQADLLYRLSKGLLKREKGVVFLVGAALPAPLEPGTPGVSSTDGIIQMIREEFSGDPTQLASLDGALDAAGEKRYQAAFFFLQGHSGQSAANEIVKRAVLGARLKNENSGGVDIDVPSASDDELRVMEFDSNWKLGPGIEALGKLAAHYPHRFGKTVLTTNFDPLIEIAIRKAGGEYFKTALHADGNLSQTEARGCHVAHLHGYWYGSDTLHTASQLLHARPHLKASLASLLRNKLVVVCGYGGWDDVFTVTLLDVVCDDTASPEILWTFHAKSPVIAEALGNRISAGLSRGRVSLYAGVDCNSFFPQIYDTWTENEKPAVSQGSAPTNRVQIKLSLRQELENTKLVPSSLQGDDEDRPPVVDLCVGREVELQLIRESKAKVVFVTGIGGQGKSTLAAQYYSDAQQQRTHNYYVWRDCKEESERFENQLASVVETLCRKDLRSGLGQARYHLHSAAIYNSDSAYVRSLNFR